MPRQGAVKSPCYRDRVILHSEREEGILDNFCSHAATMIGQWADYGIVGNDNTFRGPGRVDSYITSTRSHGTDVVLRIRRRDFPWFREIRMAPNISWGESTNGGPVEHSSADFPSEQKAIIRRLFDDIW